MLRKTGVLFRTLLGGVAALLGWLLLPNSTIMGVAQAQPISSPGVFSVNYFDITKGDGTVHIVNPTTTTQGIVCAMIYVYDAHEEQQECCGCPVTNDGLRVISVKKDLTANPLSGTTSPGPTGVIKILSTTPNATSGSFSPCNPALVTASELEPTLRSAETHINTFSPSGAAGITETLFQGASESLSSAELNALTGTCAFIHTNGSGRGVCTCGTGDNVAPVPGAGGRR